MPIKIRRNPETKHVQARSQIIPVSLIIAVFFGVMLVVYLIIDSGAAQVAHAMLVIGWGLIPITLYHLIPFTLSALSWREPVSDPPHGLEVLRPGGVGLDLGPQPPDMHGDRRGVGVERVLPHRVHQLVARERLPGMASQEQQHVELSLGELDLLAPGEHLARARIDRHVAQL